MMKPYIKQKAFSRPSSGKRQPKNSWPDTELSAACLNELSVFETLRARGGRIELAGEHWRRLFDSCRGLSRKLPMEAAQIDAWVRDCLKQSGFREAVLRLSVHWLGEHAGKLLVNIRPIDSLAMRKKQLQGIRVATTVLRRATPRASNAQIKSSQYVSGVLAILDQPGGMEAEPIFLDQHLHLAESTIANIFIIKQKRSATRHQSVGGPSARAPADIKILTPPAASGILRGVTRDRVMKLARARGLEVEEVFLTRHELYNADECFLTNAVSEILPVVWADGRSIGGGRPGPITQMLALDFKKGCFSSE